MSTYNKAKQVIERLLGEYNRPGNHQPISIVSIISDGEVIPVSGDGDGQGNYVYLPGYNGADSHKSKIIIQSDEPLTPFNDFYGDPSKYPIIAEISAALEAAGFDGLEGIAAGILRPAMNQK